MQATRWWHFRTRRVRASWLALLLVALAIGADRPGDQTTRDQTTRDQTTRDQTTRDQVSSKQALSKLQDYVGQWRGVGQVRRGSTQGAWSETADWAWKFKEGNASLDFKVDDAKYFETGTLKAVAGDTFKLIVESDDAKLTYIGQLDESGTLILNAADAPSGKPARISIRQVADGKRMLLLFERRVGDDRYLRMAEVGYTRQGSSFGKGTNYIECIVTGGVGTIPVTFEGKTYYVCCTGCRDLFNDDPAAVIAEYREQKELEKAKDK